MWEVGSPETEWAPHPRPESMGTLTPCTCALEYRCHMNSELTSE